MALIECPECGEKISDTANKCVHCGYKFVICPECGKVTNSTLPFCENCGFELSQVKAEISARDAQPQAVAVKKSCIERWKQYDIFRGNSNLIIFAVSTVLLITAIILLAVFGFKVYDLSKKDGNSIFDYIDQLDTLISFSQSGKSLLIAACICLALRNPLAQFSDFYKPWSINMWIRSRKGDLATEIINFGTPTKDNYYECNWLMEAEYFNANPLIRKKQYYQYAFSIISSTLFWIFLGNFAVGNFEQFILFGSKLKWDFLFLIIAAVIFAVRVIEEFIFNKNIEQSETLWRNKTYPTLVANIKKLEQEIEEALERISDKTN